MKKRLFLFVLIISFIVSLGLTSPTIIVTNPHSGSIWYNGQTYTITWNKSGQMNDHVKIRLLKNGLKVLDITNSTLNNGSFHWTVPNSVQSGNYVIRVKTLDNQVYDDSDVFTIANQPSPSGSLTVVKPAAGDCWEKGNIYEIQWNSSNITELVKIRLYQGSTRVLAISDSTANDGSYSWTVPNNLSDGNYKIMIKTLSNQYSDMSDEFLIKTSCSSSGGGSTPFPGNMNFVAGLNLVELAVFIHGPGPRIKQFSEIKAALEKSNVQKPVTVKLYQGNREVANLGTYAPTVRSGRVRFNTMPSVMKLNLSPRQRAMMEENPQGFKLVLFSEGKVIGRSPLNVVVANDNVRRPSGVSYNKLRVIQGAKIPSCPDPAVVDIQFSIVRRYSDYRARVRVTGIVKNIGGADYISRPNQQNIVLDIGDAAHPLKVKKFQNLKRGEEVRIVYETDWSSSSPNEGEFPSTFRVYIVYDPDISMDSNPNNDDCNPRNNGKSKSGKAINDMIRNR